MVKRRFIAAALCVALQIVVAPVVIAQGVKPEAATDQQKQNARTLFSAAMVAYNAKRFDDALSGFRRSYEAVASPNSHLMIARTLRGMGRTAEAYEELRAVTAEAEAAAAQDPKYQQSADAARADLAAIESDIGLVRIVGAERAREGAQLSVGGRVVDRDRWSEPVPVTPGKVVVHLVGQKPKEVEVEAGATVEVDVTPPPAPKVDRTKESTSGYDGPDRMTMAFVAGGVGVVGLLMYAVFGSLALVTYADIDDQCTDKHCSPALMEDADRGRGFQTTANVGFVIGIIGLATGGGLLAWALLDKEGQEKAGIEPRLAVGPGSVSLKVSY